MNVNSTERIKSYSGFSQLKKRRESFGVRPRGNGAESKSPDADRKPRLMEEISSVNAGVESGESAVASRKPRFMGMSPVNTGVMSGESAAVSGKRNDRSVRSDPTDQSPAKLFSLPGNIVTELYGKSKNRSGCSGCL